jgi:methyl-accepting chemotaxis protein
VELNFKRRRFLINSRFQLRFAFYLCTWSLALSAIFPVLLNQTFMLLAEQLIQNPNGPEVAYIMDVRKEILLGIYALEAVFLVAVFGISIFISHRIAGPLYKLNEFFKEAAATGQLKRDLRFRSTDHFQEIAQSYNAMVEAVSKKSSS